MFRKLNDKFQENVSRPGIIDTRARYRAAARRLRNTDVDRDGQTVEMKWEERCGWIQHRISKSEGDTHEQHKGDAGKKICSEGGTDIALLTIYKDETINSET